MKRTTITVPDRVARALEREARRRGSSVSAVAREAISEHLHLTSEDERSLPFAGVGRSGARDTAERAEEILSAEWPSDRDR